MKLKSSNKLTLFLIVFFVLILMLVLFESIEEKEAGDFKVYENQELGFTFSYPSYWGKPRAEYFQNSIPDLNGRVFSIEFVQEEIDELGIIPAISEDYFAAPLIQSFSADYEVYETIPPFIENYNQEMSSLEFCERFVKNTLVNSGCKEEIISGRRITTVIYGYYIEEGMFGYGDELYFEQASFIPLDDEEFPGLEAGISVYTFEDESLKTKNQEELKELAKQELDKVLSSQAPVYTQDKIKAFKEFVKSFKF